jgi:hypothetical protein
VPFTEAAFLDVFGAYNSALWPVVAASWLVTTLMALRWWRRRSGGREWLVVLAMHWAWSGIVYHWWFFRAINPVAAGFAALFVLQAAAFAWLAVNAPVRFGIDRTWRGVLGGGLVAYAVAYPFIGLALGLEYPRAPLFAVPCPTTILTAGLLLTANGLPRLIAVGPALWAVVGSSAALALGIEADTALIACALLLMADIARATYLRRSPA